jgi:hypothetical protein
VFVTTKIAPADHGDPRAYDAGLECMSRLGLEYIDLLLLHWPGTRGELSVVASWLRLLLSVSLLIRSFPGLDVKDERNRTNRLGSWIALQVSAGSADARLSMIDNSCLEMAPCRGCTRKGKSSRLV